MANRKVLVKAAARIKEKMKELGIPRQKHDAGIIFSYDAKPIKMVNLYKFSEMDLTLVLIELMNGILKKGNNNHELGKTQRR